MGWCSATDIMDAALEGAERAVTAAWQLATDNEHARTPAFANALQADPTLRTKLDDVLRPFVVTIAQMLRDSDWDCTEESQYFDRFRQEMLGYSDDQMITWYREKITETDEPDIVREYSACMAELMEGPH